MQPQFVAAGWQAGRRVDVDARVPEHHPAYKMLEQLGDLHVGKCGPGVECAASDLKFCFCEADQEIAAVWCQLLGSPLVGIAEIHNRYGWLLVDEAGRCFGANQVDDVFCYRGRNLGEAIQRLLLGLRARPMLRPDQHEVMMYGEPFSREHPSVFTDRF